MRTTRTTAAAAIAALALPSAALATGGDQRHDHGRHDHGKAAGHRAADSRGDAARTERKKPARKRHGTHRHGQKKHAGHKRKGWARHRKHRRFVLLGVGATGLDVRDGRLAGPITLDPVAANAAARRLLKLTREALRGEDTVQVGAAGDAVELRLKGVGSAAAIQPTDVVKIHGRIDRRTGALDIRTIHVKRKA